MLAVGLGAPPSSITGIKELVAAHFEVAVKVRQVSASAAVETPDA
jgi:hypothetical protein